MSTLQLTFDVEFLCDCHTQAWMEGHDPLNRIGRRSGVNHRDALEQWYSYISYNIRRAQLGLTKPAMLRRQAD